MTIDKSGPRWVGSSREDIGPFLEESAGERGIGAFRVSRCLCGSSRFRVEADPGAGAGRRTCTACKSAWPIGRDPDAEGPACACPACGAQALNLGVGLALRPGTSAAAHLYLGVRCPKCGTLAEAGDWPLDGPPSGPLLDALGPAPTAAPTDRTPQ